MWSYSKGRFFFCLFVCLKAISYYLPIVNQWARQTLLWHRASVFHKADLLEIHKVLLCQWFIAMERFCYDFFVCFQLCVWLFLWCTLVLQWCTQSSSHPGGTTFEFVQWSYAWSIPSAVRECMVFHQWLYGVDFCTTVQSCFRYVHRMLLVISKQPCLEGCTKTCFIWLIRYRRAVCT